MTKEPARQPDRIRNSSEFGRKIAFWFAPAVLTVVGAFYWVDVIGKWNEGQRHRAEQEVAAQKLCDDAFRDWVAWNKQWSEEVDRGETNPHFKQISKCITAGRLFNTTPGR